MVILGIGGNVQITLVKTIKPSPTLIVPYTRIQFPKQYRIFLHVKILLYMGARIPAKVLVFIVFHPVKSFDMPAKGVRIPLRGK